MWQIGPPSISFDKRQSLSLDFGAKLVLFFFLKLVPDLYYNNIINSLSFKFFKVNINSPCLFINWEWKIILNSLTRINYKWRTQGQKWDKIHKIWQKDWFTAKLTEKGPICDKPKRIRTVLPKTLSSKKKKIYCKINRETCKVNMSFAWRYEIDDDATTLMITARGKEPAAQSPPTCHVNYDVDFLIN